MGLNALEHSKIDEAEADPDDLNLEQYPITKSLSGILKDFEYDESDYYRYLEEKYR